MLRTIQKLLVAAIALGATSLACARPGIQLATYTISPLDVPKVVAAWDAYMASSVGKEFKGRAVLRQRVADGDDPATHSMAIWFHSQAEFETFTNAAMNSPERQALVSALHPIAPIVATSRSSIVRRWGVATDNDTVWLSLATEVNDIAAFNDALDKWLASPMSRKTPGQGYLLSIIAGGRNSPTHVALLGFASFAEMETYRDGLDTDPD